MDLVTLVFAYLFGLLYVGLRNFVDDVYVRFWLFRRLLCVLGVVWLGFCLGSEMLVVCGLLVILGLVWLFTRFWVLVIG